MTRRFRSLALLTLLVFQVITVVAVLTLTTSTTERVVVDQMRQTLAANARDLASRTDAFLTPTEDTVLLTSALIENLTGTLALDELTTLEAYLVQTVATQPDLTGVYFGQDDGSFLFVSRDGASEPGGTFTKRIEIDGDERTVTLIQRDAAGTVVSTNTDPDDPYDPTTRPWYLQATTDEPTWTDPYVFFTVSQPGVTASQLLRSDPPAVVGADVSLGRLSEFLVDIEVSERSQAFIIDREGILLAAPDPSTVITLDATSGELRQSTIDDTAEPLAAAASAVVRAELAAGPTVSSRRTDGEQSFTFDDERWQVAIAKLPGEPEWVVVLVSPESDFVADVVSAQRQIAALALLVVLATVLVAVPIATRAGKAVQRINDRATTDTLTKVANRRGFEEQAQAAIERAGDTGEPLCLALVDLDLFKAVNDTWGHPTGDQALELVARRLNSAVRAGDLVGRVGGDEFAIVLVDTPIELAAEVLERARSSVAEGPLRTDDAEIPLSVTVGITERGGDRELAALMTRADEALYSAKDAGRNQVAIQGPSSAPPSDARDDDDGEGDRRRGSRTGDGSHTGPDEQHRSE